ncbi:MAG: PAS domain-containing protein [Gammaproteobacteria bacterium]
MQRIAERGYCDPFQKQFLHRDGYPVPVYVGGALMEGQQGNGIAFVLDRSKEQQLEDQMRLSATVLEASLDGIVICDPDWRALTANDAYCVMTGMAREALTQSPVAFCVPEDREMAKMIRHALTHESHWQGDSLIPARMPSRCPCASVSVR